MHRAVVKAGFEYAKLMIDAGGDPNVADGEG